ncbi:MAG: hypothetical protein IKD73_00695 [Selenomonadaceae bacterium]|nr:hypothetical protein [Selenomonadaceae bacterium]
MINYDLLWNPNRLEQRFGRIHRIGQKEVCHLWNLVANDTREGQVFLKLLKKFEEERAALGGQVFDILGKISFNREHFLLTTTTMGIIFVCFSMSKSNFKTGGARPLPSDCTSWKFRRTNKLSS